MLPYPSGEPHIGHLKVYSVGDAVAHFHRRMGHRVLHPMGYDAFGLPAENHAIKTGQHPRDSTDAAIASFQRQFREWGISIDWSREFGTHEPRYYRWTQWIFLQLFERGLAYRKEAAVKWCPNDQTVLANEQVIDGRCERCGARGRGAPARAVVLPHHRLRRPPARRPRHDRLARARQDDAAQLDRALRGRRGHVPLRGAGHRLPGLHHAPGHAVRRDVLRHGARAPGRVPAGRGHRARAGGPRVRQPRAQRVQRGARRRRQARRPACCARPQRGQPGQRRAAADVRRRLRAHGVRHRRDHGGARPTTSATTRSPRRSTCRSARSSSGGEDVQAEPYTGDGALVNSHPEFDGLPNREALERIVDWLDREGKGHASVNYRLRDWLLSRQRYWGCPIPVVHCRAVRDRPRARGPAARPAAGHRRLRARRAARRWPPRRTGSTRPARPAVGPPSARPTRWTRSSTRRGTSCATATPTTTRPPGTRRSCASGCRSTSTSAASSTRSCT